MSNTLSAAPSLDDAQALRQANADWLSLALMDARNCTLRRLAMFEDAQALAPREAVSPLWLAGHGAWFQEYWLARHVQRTRGELAAPDGARLASIEPRADDWFGGATQDCQGLDAPTLRAYLAATLETTLELLETAADNDQGLYFYRMALMHEDRLCETLAELAMTWQLKVNKELAAPPPRVDREALLLPGQRFMLGSLKTGQKTTAPTGLVPDNERWAHEVVVPEFEIDAQPVNWARYVQFAEDGGYDDPAHWSDEGWHWLSRQARRAPRNVEQMRGGVLVMRHGAMQRAPAGQAVMHISRHEAQAWCAWAGRRLPTEPEWELAASTATARGFVWGDVFEWVAGSAKAWPGYSALPGTSADILDKLPAARTQGVLRGGSWLTRKRLLHAKARRFSAPERDGLFCGFRSCAL